MNLNKLFPSLLPVFPGFITTTEKSAARISAHPLLPVSSKVGYRAILTSLVSYKSPDNVPDTFTPDVMQTLIRLHSALPFLRAFHGHNRDYPFSTSLSLNEASVGISLYSAPFILTLVTHGYHFPYRSPQREFPPDAA
jgi:hypothetical protein